MTSVALAVTDGMSLFELAIPCTVFGPSGLYSVQERYELVVCAAPGTRIGGWLRADTTHRLEELVDADTVIVPACDVAVDVAPEDLVAAVRAAHARGARIASICTGAFVLAAAGLLDGRRATTHWMYAAALGQRYPNVEVDASVLYIDDGDVLTSAGQAAGIDLCLHMVRLDHGADVANNLARRLVLPAHRAGGQAQFITSPLPRDGGHCLSETLDWALAHLHEPLSVTDLARRAHLSTRQLGRQFAITVGTPPLRWLLTQRVRRAQELLETTERGIDQIAESVGMGTGATLRRHFNRTIGISPDAYRRAFRADHPTRRTTAG